MTTTGPDAPHAPGEAIRPLGPFERVIDLFAHHNPLQFSLVAEVDRPVTATDLTATLERLQHRHPMLRVAVDRSATGAVYRTAEGALPLEVAAAGTPWQAVVAREQTRPIAPAPGPLARAVLVPGDPGSAVVLTFAHQIADGVGGLQALLDLVGALGGDELAPSGFPEPQEDLLARVGTNGPLPDGPPPAADERMDTVGELAPFTGDAPHVDTLALDQDLTARLVRRCRLERTSVHAALCAAVSLVLHGRGRDHVRVLTPMDLRRAVGLPEEVANRFAGARTGSTAGEAADLWTLARRTSGALAHHRAAHALKAGAEALAGQPPEKPAESEAMMAAATAADVQITNLGVAGPGHRSTSALTALWGPAQTTQLRGEHIIGVVTLGGRLRMTELTHDPVAVLLPDLAATLAEACAGPYGETPAP